MVAARVPPGKCASNDSARCQCGLRGAAAHGLSETVRKPSVDRENCDDAWHGKAPCVRYLPCSGSFLMPFVKLPT